MASQRICLSVAPENDAQSSSAMSFLTLPGKRVLEYVHGGAVDRAEEAAAEALKGEPIDLLINNAGKGGGIPDVTKAEIMKLLEVNAVSPFQIYPGSLATLDLTTAKCSKMAIWPLVWRRVASVRRSSVRRQLERRSHISLETSAVTKTAAAKATKCRDMGSSGSTLTMFGIPRFSNVHQSHRSARGDRVLPLTVETLLHEFECRERHPNHCTVAI
ncbi:hypothetical protein PF007_g26827 [Phytophthora fragariae]|uniref:Uncharacterized protein n=1 Tax=Phytophthora fragariae TaxID=53985 RepID=A0A6A3Q8D2_9STRA|nr:hypothetical protein PF007_g26827 [Phytophthora fragariae]